MKVFKKIIIISSFILCVKQVQAYTFTFRNKTNVSVKVEMQLSGIYEPHHAITVEPGKENYFNFEGGRIWFCMNSNTLRLTPDNGSTLELPVFFARQEIYDQIINEVNKTGKSTVVVGRIGNRLPSLCRSEVFDIVMVTDYYTKKDIVRAITVRKGL